MQQNGIKKQTYGNNVQNNKNNIPKTEEIGSILNFNKNKKNEKENIEKSEKVNSEESLSESFKSMFTGERNTNPEEEISTKDFVKEKIYTLNEYVGVKGDIIDPYGGNVYIYEKTFFELESSIKLLFAKLKRR